jgi:hypothetical protein
MKHIIAVFRAKTWEDWVVAITLGVLALALGLVLGWLT